MMQVLASQFEDAWQSLSIYELMHGGFEIAL